MLLDNTVEHMGKAFLGMTFNSPAAMTICTIRSRTAIITGCVHSSEPYDVRVDCLAAQPNVELDGIAGVDHASRSADVPFRGRGQDTDPKKDDPLTPGVPDVLGNADFKIEPVHLPASAFNPGLRGFLDKTRRGRAAVEKGREPRRKRATKLATARELRWKNARRRSMPTARLP